MTLPRRHALLGLPALLATPALGQSSSGAAWPGDKPLRMVVPFPPGGATDSSARVVAEFIGAKYGRPMVVENRPGAGGTVGAEVVARSAPDGHTWLMGTPGILAISPFLYPSLSFDPKRDLAPVSLVFTTDHVLTVHPATPVRSVADFLAFARPGQRGGR